MADDPCEERVTLRRSTLVALEQVLYVFERWLVATWDSAEQRRLRAEVQKAHALVAADAGVSIGPVRSATGHGLPAGEAKVRAADGPTVPYEPGATRQMRIHRANRRRGGE